MRSYATLHSRTPFRLMDSSAVWQRRANNGRPTGEQEEQVPAKRVAIPVFLFLASRQYLHTTLLLKQLPTSHRHVALAPTTLLGAAIIAQVATGAEDREPGMRILWIVIQVRARNHHAPLAPVLASAQITVTSAAPLAAPTRRNFEIKSELLPVRRIEFGVEWHSEILPPLFADLLTELVYPAPGNPSMPLPDLFRLAVGRNADFLCAVKYRLVEDQQKVVQTLIAQAQSLCLREAVGEFCRRLLPPLARRVLASPRPSKHGFGLLIGQLLLPEKAPLDAIVNGYLTAIYNRNATPRAFLTNMADVLRRDNPLRAVDEMHTHGVFVWHLFIFLSNYSN